MILERASARRDRPRERQVFQASVGRSDARVRSTVAYVGDHRRYAVAVSARLSRAAGAVDRVEVPRPVEERPAPELERE